MIVVALLTHFGYLALSDDFYFPDSITYLGPARSLIAGNGFSTEWGAAETMRTPGYPLFLAPLLWLADRPLPIVALQHLLCVLLAGAVYLLAMRLSGKRLPALIAGLLFALDVPTIHYANKVLSETVFTFALMIVLCLIVRIQNAAVPRGALFLTAGVLTGALVLIRPVAILFFVPVALTLVMSVARPRDRLTSLFVVAALILPLGWGVRNQRRTGVFTISSIAGVNLLLHRAAGVLAIEEGGDFRQQLASFQQILQRDAEEKLRAEYGGTLDTLPHAVVAAEFGRIARPIILHHPVALAELIARGVFINVFDSDWEAILVVSRVDARVLSLMLNASTAIVFALVASGVIVLWRRHGGKSALLPLTLGYFLMMSAGGESEARFRVPLAPLMAIAAGVGAAAVLEKGRDSIPAGIRPAT